ncbi:MAG: bifunctional adenosylcobinamide kinase/adenosylcobinamide-phosphate guanylyltransferase [Candidatus Geothermincolales bacterium]
MERVDGGTRPCMGGIYPAGDVERASSFPLCRSADHAGEMRLLLGGTRSGKSSLAVAMAEGLGGDLLFLATARDPDPEMEDRIRRHREERSSNWKTLEWNGEAFPGLPDRVEVVLLDSVTLLASDILVREWERSGRPIRGASFAMDLVDEVSGRVIRLVRDLRRRSRFLLVVGDEVGLGTVPPDPLGRAFRDLCGTVNRLLARESDRVYFVVAGLPFCLKGDGSTLMDPPSLPERRPERVPEGVDPPP